MSKLEVNLIRHGKTKANEERLYCGKSDVSLSENGINELRDMKVEYPKCNEYFTSGAKRANETFSIVFPTEKFKELKEFWEYDFGDFELKSYEMLKEDKAYVNWICDNEGIVSCPNGESKFQYKKRIKKAFLELIDMSLKNKNKSICLLCHGGTIGTILEVFYDSSKSFYEHQPICGRGYKLIIEKDNDMKIIEVTDI